MTIRSPISAEAIQEFKAIYRQEFGENLSDDEAKEMGLNLLRLLKMLLEPSKPASPEPPGVIKSG